MPDNGQDGLPGRVRQRANAEVMRRSPCCVAWPVTESSWHQVQAEPEPVAIHHLALPGKEQSVPPATLRWPAGRGRNRHGCPQWPLPRRRTLLPLVADLSQPATNYRQTRRIVVNASRFSRTSQPLTNLPMPSRPSDCFEVAMKSLTETPSFARSSVAVSGLAAELVFTPDRSPSAMLQLPSSIWLNTAL